MQAGDELAVGEVRVQLSATGDFRVVDAAARLLWQSGTSSSCTGTPGCRITFQGDGNLVLADSAGTVWTTATWESPGAVLTFSNHPPYAVITHRDGAELWSSWKLPDPALDLEAPPVAKRRGAGYDYVTFRAGEFSQKPGEPLALNRARVELSTDGELRVIDACERLLFSGNIANESGYLTVSRQAPYLVIHDDEFQRRWSSDEGPARARSAQSFLDSLGVNVHMTQYEHDVTTVIEKLDYLGVRSIRDGYLPNHSLKRNYRALAEHGIRSHLLLGGSPDFGSLIGIAELVNEFGQLGAIEGPNEINNFPFQCEDSVWASGWPNDNGPAALCYASKFYNALLNTPALSGVGMFALTGAESANGAEALGLLHLKDKADFANIHPYPKNGEQPLPTLLRNLREAFRNVTPEHAVVTETGYTTADVSERAQAILVINSWLEAFARGFPQTFVYELTDNSSELYGLFDRDGQPKPVADVTHRLTRILADSGAPPASPEGLDYRLEGFSGRRILLQKSTGQFVLILWEDPVIWRDKADVVPPMKTVTLTLGGRARRVRHFDPYRSDVALQEWPSTTSVGVPLSDHAIILELDPAAP